MSSHPSPAPPPDYLTPVIYHTLVALSSGPLHGYAISQQVEEMTGGRVKMGPGTLYGTLNRLADKGWVEQAEVRDDEEAPHADRRRYHRLTAAGSAVLEWEARRLAEAVSLATARSILGGS